MQYQRAFAVLAIVFSSLGAATSQITTIKEIGGKTVVCTHSGLSSDLKECDTRSDWYSYVFVGSITAIRPIKDDEMELQIVPEEIFSGKPSNPLMIRTSQAPCLPKLVVGDRWLFFLREQNGKPIILDYGGNDSLPVAQAQKQIETLRRPRDDWRFRNRAWHGGARLVFWA